MPASHCPQVPSCQRTQICWSSEGHFQGPSVLHSSVHAPKLALTVFAAPLQECCVLSMPIAFGHVYWVKYRRALQKSICIPAKLQLLSGARHPCAPLHRARWLSVAGFAVCWHRRRLCGIPGRPAADAVAGAGQVVRLSSQDVPTAYAYELEAATIVQPEQVSACSLPLSFFQIAVTLPGQSGDAGPSACSRRHGCSP